MVIAALGIGTFFLVFGIVLFVLYFRNCRRQGRIWTPIGGDPANSDKVSVSLPFHVPGLSSEPDRADGGGLGYSDSADNMNDEISLLEQKPFKV